MHAFPFAGIYIRERLRKSWKRRDRGEGEKLIKGVKDSHRNTTSLGLYCQVSFEKFFSERGREYI